MKNNLSEPTLQLHKKKRLANMELLRILAMCMVVTLHYLGKGGLLSGREEAISVIGVLSWIIEAFAIVAVNVYVLLSGYFLVDAGFRFKRLLSLLFQVLFYSVGIPVVMVATGLLQGGDLTIYQLIQYIFPVNMAHYWFITAYVLMYLFAPVLNAGVKAMSKVQLKITIIMLVIAVSLSKTILPFALETDNEGYDVLWFLCLYLVAAYIRLYGIPYFKSLSKSLLTYLGVSIATLSLAGILLLLSKSTGSFENFVMGSYDYNHILPLIGAVALFYVFYHLTLLEGMFSRFICKISPYTLGVYLLHEHIEVRLLWPGWLGAGTDTSVLFFFLRYLMAVVVVMTIGIIVDYLRSRVFALIGRGIGRTKVGRWLDSIESKMK